MVPVQLVGVCGTSVCLAPSSIYRFPFSVVCDGARPLHMIVISYPIYNVRVNGICPIHPVLLLVVFIYQAIVVCHISRLLVCVPPLYQSDSEWTRVCDCDVSCRVDCK